MTGVFGGGGAFEGALIHVRHEVAFGGQGGSLSSGGWRTRPLNVEKTNKVAGASLAASRLTLPAGQYFAVGNQRVRRVNGVKGRLYDITGAAELVLGDTTYPNAAVDACPSIHLNGAFSLAVASEVEFQVYCETTYATTGMGVGFAAPAVNNVFADLMVWKVG